MSNRHGRAIGNVPRVFMPIWGLKMVPMEPVFGSEVEVLKNPSKLT